MSATKDLPEMSLSAEIAAMADAMKRTDPRAPVLRRAVIALKAWEMHAATEARRAPKQDEQAPEPREVQCGLCGNEGRRYTPTCPECGGHW